MSKIKELWQQAVFRWCVYQAPLLIFGLLLKVGLLSGLLDHRRLTKREPYYFGREDFGDFAIPIWILIFTLPAVWVWRKPLFSWLNKKAEEG